VIVEFGLTAKWILTGIWTGSIEANRLGHGRWKIMCCQWVKSGENRIDPCARAAIILLNKNGVKTVACCCGHSIFKPTIIVQESSGLFREIISGLIIPRKKRFYFRDKQTGVLYIPEVEDHQKPLKQ